MIFLTLATCTTYFYIRQGEEFTFIVNVKDKLALSNVYSPVKFIFDDVEDNNVTLIDSSTKKGAEFTIMGFKEKPIKSKKEQKFKIVYSSVGKYYIMYEDKCLQVKEKPFWLFKKKPKNYKSLKFGSCTSKRDKLFDIRFDAKLIKEYDHIILPCKHHKKHFHYNAFDHYCGYHNPNRRTGYNRMMKDISATEVYGHEMYIDTNEFYQS